MTYHCRRPGDDARGWRQVTAGDGSGRRLGDGGARGLQQFGSQRGQRSPQRITRDHAQPDVQDSTDLQHAPGQVFGPGCADSQPGPSRGLDEKLAVPPRDQVEDETVVADQQEVEFDDPKDQPSDWVQVAVVVAVSVGGILLLLSPLIVIAILKGRRAARRRKKGEIADQVAGAWDEVVDRARDLGFVAVRNHTRRESADDLQEGYPDLPIRSMADRVDASVFGPGEPETEVRDSVWKQGGKLRSSLIATKPWYARPAVFFSLKSLRRVGVETEWLSRKSQTSGRAGRNEDSTGGLKK